MRVGKENIQKFQFQYIAYHSEAIETHRFDSK